MASIYRKYRQFIAPPYANVAIKLIPCMITFMLTALHVSLANLGHARLHPWKEPCIMSPLPAYYLQTYVPAYLLPKQHAWAPHVTWPTWNLSNYCTASTKAAATIKDYSHPLHSVRTPTCFCTQSLLAVIHRNMLLRQPLCFDFIIRSGGPEITEYQS
jgi:hypothetical protein